jgi:hypothetical protein
MTRHLPGVPVAAEFERRRPGELLGHRPDPLPPRQILFKCVEEPERVHSGHHPDADGCHVAVDQHRTAGFGPPLNQQTDLFPRLGDLHEEVAAESGRRIGQGVKFQGSAVFPVQVRRRGYANFGGLTTEFLHAACRKGGPLFAPVEVILKGKEGRLPEGTSFLDKDGHARTEIRTRWYLSPAGHTYRTYALQADEIACDLPLAPDVVAAAAPYPATAKPVFFGHYWLAAERPERLADNVACLDYSVAKGGFLCGYRWGGEAMQANEKFVWARS